MRVNTTETDPRTKIIRNMIGREEHTIFDSWIHDDDPTRYGIHNNHVTIDTNTHMFRSNVVDSRRCNHITPGYFPNDQTFKVTHIGIHISFSDRNIEKEFMRSAVLQLSVGDRTVHMLHCNMLAQPYPFAERLEDPDPAKCGLLLWMKIDRSIVIPPRQGFYVELQMQKNLLKTISEFTQQARSFGMIKVMLKGIRTTPVYEDQLNDDQRSIMAKQHEEMMQQAEEERLASQKRLDHYEARRTETLAFLLNTFSQPVFDITAEHVTMAEKVMGDVILAIYSIGGGGYGGGVPPFSDNEGFIDVLEIGKKARGFSGKYQSIDQGMLEDEAWRIAKEWVSNNKPLDESYRQEVAAAVGIDNYKSAVVSDS